MFQFVHILQARRSYKIKMANLKSYWESRDEVIKTESQKYLGSHLILDERENLVNDFLMSEKTTLINNGLTDSKTFIGSKHFFDVFNDIKDTKIFQIIQKLPKGGALHVHDTALLSTDKIIKLTYHDYLWISGNVFSEVPKLKFSKSCPQQDSSSNLSWRLINDVRKEAGVTSFDKALRGHLTLYCDDPTTTYRDIDVIWAKFMDLFSIIDSVVLFDEIWTQYFYNALEDFLEDGVQYLEFRGVLPEVFNLEGKIYSQSEVIGLYYETLQRFKKEHPDFIGCKFIFAPLRFIDCSMLQDHLSVLKQIQSKYPDFVAGFDLVGQEDKGVPLKKFVPVLLEEKNITYFFHAGETNWNGSTPDENLIDAILLNTKRIGHGFASVKHPWVLENIKKRQICVEINPISNQVLKLVDDLRNHPAAVLFSDDHPVVVSSDDPSFWEAKPLSHDFFFAFLAIASAKADLRLIKQLALNSIQYSAMSHEEKLAATQKWQQSWEKAISGIVDQFKV